MLPNIDVFQAMCCRRFADYRQPMIREDELSMLVHKYTIIALHCSLKRTANGTSKPYPNGEDGHFSCSEEDEKQRKTKYNLSASM